MPGVTVFNSTADGGVALNQVLVRFDDDDATTRAVMAGVLASGQAFMSGTTWNGKAAMRVSVCNWTTTPGDVDRSLDAVRDALAQVRATRASRSEFAS
jgi:aromatic-L-amino-acid decarboxylase